MRLKKSGPLHLLLRRSDDANSNQFWSVFVYSNFSDLTSNWRPGDRTSPIFPSSSASVPDIGAGRIRWLLLLGPLYPGSLDPSMYGHTYLTMGMFNTLLYCRTKKQFDSAKRLIKPLGVPWETWKLRGHKLIEIETSSKGRRTDGHKKLTRRIVTNKHLRAAESQYRLLIAETLSKALEYCPHHISDWSFFDQSLRATVKENKLDIATRQGMLAITNAILTRHLQQAYSGTTPVTLTQGHLTTHSLLGIGLPSLALMRLSRFVGTALRDANFEYRFAQLKNQSPKEKPLYSLPPDHGFWHEDNLAIDEAKAPPPPEMVVLTPACFSGRDGFRSTNLTLTAPLEVVSSANTERWTLLTVTHELVHRVISATLEFFLPQTSDKKAWTQLTALLWNSRTPQNLFEQAQEFLCFAVCQLDPAYRSHDKKLKDPESLQALFADHWDLLNEILTHCFDFRYFYRKNEDSYLTSIWASWDAIPNIGPRVESYIVRTLCAIYSGRYTYADGLQSTIETTVNCLKKTSVRFPDATYVKLAIDELQTRPKFYIQHLKARSHLVKFAAGILYSADVEKVVSPIDLLSAKRGRRYSRRQLEFGADQIKNPITFLETFATDKEPDIVDSLWVLSNVAFGDA